MSGRMLQSRQLQEATQGSGVSVKHHTVKTYLRVFFQIFPHSNVEFSFTDKDVKLGISWSDTKNRT